ncbi:hemolysin family protein [soil metagenome]
MEVVLLIVLIFANGLFSMSEMAVATSRRTRLQPLADAGDKKSIEVLQLHDEPTNFLSTVQIGITSITVLNGIVGESTLSTPLADWLLQVAPIVGSYAPKISFVVVVFVITMLSIVFGELVPKRLGQIFPEAIARTVVRPMRMLSWIATPVVKVLSASTNGLLRLLGVKPESAPVVTEEEIHVLMEQGAESGIFEKSEHEMVRNVFRLDDRKLTSLMVPRGDIVFLDIEDPIELNQDKIEGSNVSRFPVCRGGLRDVIGFARAKDLLGQSLAGGTLDLTANLQPALYVPETLTGTELIKNLREARASGARVVDEYGEVEGLVTLKDVLEAIIGEMPAQLAGDESATRREDGSWLFDGLIALQEMQDRIDLDELPEGHGDSFHTLSGMIMMLLGRIPHTGDRVEWGGWMFEVVDMDGKRIDKVLAEPVEASPEEETTG